MDELPVLPGSKESVICEFLKHIRCKLSVNVYWYIHKNKEYPTNYIQIYYIKHLKHFQPELVEVRLRNIIKENFQMNGGVFPLALCI